VAHQSRRSGFEEPPDPAVARTLDELITMLGRLKAWTDLSFTDITKRVNDAWRKVGRPRSEWAAKSTVADCFSVGRRRPNSDLVIAIVRAMNPDEAYVDQWRRSLRAVLGEAKAATVVTVWTSLPRPDEGIFVGRTVELEAIKELAEHASRGAAIIISSIGGMAGVGKTELAIRSGHLLLEQGRFRDVQLFVNLRGFHGDPGQPPADPAAVLEGFLRGLGVPGSDIPVDLEARAAMYRAEMLGRNGLIVLDNAVNEDQVRPLLPESPTCLTLVTSRRSLDQLPDAHRLELNVFELEESTVLIRNAVGEHAVASEPTSVRQIAELCGGLPLALGVTVRHIQSKSTWTLADHAERLRIRRSDLRLDDPVATALSVSYQDLSSACQRLFRLLALHPGIDITTMAAASLAGCAVPIAQRLVDELVGGYLLKEVRPGRYELHDLVKAFALSLTVDEDSQPECDAALIRLLDHYVESSAAASRVLFPHERRPPPSDQNAATPAFDGMQARSWFDAERDNLLAVTGYAGRRGWSSHVDLLSSTSRRYLESTTHFSHGFEMHTLALAAARASSDRLAEGHALNALGVILLRQGRYEEAEDRLRQALIIFEAEEETAAQGAVLSNLANVKTRLHRPEEALDTYQASLKLRRQVGDRLGEGHTLNNIGFVYQRTGRPLEAIPWLTAALEVFRELPAPVDEGITLGNLGTVHGELGRYDEAIAFLQLALAVCRDVGDRSGEGDSLKELGVVYKHQRLYDKAIEHLRQAAEFVRGHDRVVEAETLTCLGEVLAATDDRAGARAAWQAALEIYDDLRSPEAGRVRTHLGSL